MSFLGSCSQKLSIEKMEARHLSPLEQKIHEQKITVNKYYTYMKSLSRELDRTQSQDYTDSRHVLQKLHAIESKWQKAQKQLEFLQKQLADSTSQ